MKTDTAKYTFAMEISVLCAVEISDYYIKTSQSRKKEGKRKKKKRKKRGGGGGEGGGTKKKKGAMALNN